MEVQGLEKAIRDIGLLRMVAKENIKQLVRETTLAVESQAQALAPVDTGNLKNSMNHSFNESGNLLQGEVSNSADYAAHVEFGTVKMEAQPYLFPAWESERPKYVEALKKELRKT